MIKKSFFFASIFLFIFTFSGCKSKNEVYEFDGMLNLDDDCNNVTRFTYISKNTGIQNNGIFDENKKVLYTTNYDIGKFYGGFSLITSNDIDCSAIDSFGNRWCDFNISSYFANDYGYGYYTAYEDPEDFETRYFINYKNEIIDMPFNGIISEKFANYKIQQDGKEVYAYFDLEKNDLLRTRQGKVFVQEYGFSQFHNGFAVVKQKGKLGLIDVNLNYILKPEYEFLNSCFGSYCIVSKKQQDFYEIFDVIDMDQNIILKDVSYPYGISENILCVNIDDDFFMYNIKTQDKIKIPENYIPKDKDWFVNFINGEYYSDNGISVFYNDKTNKYILLNERAENVLPFEADEICVSPDNGFWRIFNDGQWYLFSLNEGLVDPIEYLDFGSE